MIGWQGRRPGKARLPSAAAPYPSPTEELLLYQSQTAGASSSAQSSVNLLLDPNGPFANLNLTAQQQQQIQQIFSQLNGTSSTTATASTGGVNGTGLTPTQLFQQVENVLTPQQQAQLQNDLETIKTSHHHGHHHHGGGSASASATDPNDPSNLLAQLDLTTGQQNQISQLVQSAQTNGTAPSDLLNQITQVLTPAQQQELSQFLGTVSTTSTNA